MYVDLQEILFCLMFNIRSIQNLGCFYSILSEKPFCFSIFTDLYI